MGINGYESTEVNAKLASEGEAKYSKKTMNRKSHIKMAMVITKEEWIYDISIV
ncbi:hypothetical protein Q5M85_17740 [Paraclostridium bifermentans]|nr:hypothetical protein [Paraclostridium bifermentans]